ncbi:serine protease [Thauera aminoaromatica]|jgi:serine protease Do|uniref:Peptidase S1 and S6 chymotrypsin/Hap n=2 Tax=Thauera aminoaromatica TaxID=164330 RepID=C4ZJH5_THASP|nr:serine protease [Thauera aminoaromatica]MBX3682501.1 trypsin-like peptidase domain-containing protein [Thauera sp.]MDA0236071.1 serine protease [Pseudomonadota bacterium]ACK54357.1 peptidase S1 and S6 chymotrypsin/Hap [Thauera aminoaromatica]ENO84359.1 peptidase S1 and S6 chymotrypsin/Hap [Thauera aminoaromatica S2]MCK6399568.1 serine protease [Thauera aminoaromatica]
MNPRPETRARRRLLACALALPAALALAPIARAELASTLARVKPSVVAVGTYQRTRSPAFQFRGTGFAVGDGMLVATNAHVLPDEIDGAKMEALVIVLPGDDLTGAVRPVKVVATERAQDLALLRLEGGPPLPALRLAGGGGVVEGQEVAFTGFPIGAVLGMTPVTHRGIVSAITPIAIPQANSRDLNPALIRRLATDPFRVYQLDATAYPGNSGSPLYDPASGEVIGVLNMVFVKSTKEKVLADPSGISYAIPVEYLQRLIAGRN